MIRKNIAKAILRLAGWKITGSLPAQQCVVMMAPHTSNADFFWGWLGFSSCGYTSYFLIKKEAFNRFTSPILRAMGGIAVDRSHSSNVVHQLTEEMNRRSHMVLTITPEGTRKANRHWKRGFYFIALSAKVPVVMGFLDYKTKTGGFGPAFMPSGDYDADFLAIRAFYSDKTGRHPEKFVLPGSN